MGSEEADPYNQPGTAPTDWWNDLKTKNILIVAGKDEVLVDDIEAMAKKIQVIVSPTKETKRLRDPNNHSVLARTYRNYYLDCPWRGT